MATEALQIRVTEGGAREVKRALEDVGKAGETAKSAVEQLKEKLSSINLKSLINEAFKLTEAYQQLQTRLRSVTSSQAALDRVSGKLINTANRSRSSLEDAFDLYSNVAAGARRLGRSEDELVKVTASLAQAAKLSGASASDADEGFKAFAQGLQSGKLQGDALGTVLQRLPRVADAIARQLNVSREELQRLGDQGKITGPVLLESMSGVAPELQAEFEGMSVTVSDALDNLKSTARAAVGELGNSTGVTQLVSQAILTLGRDTDTVKKSVEFFATFIGTTLTATALPKLVSGLKSVTQAMSALRVLALANPWVALATAVAAVIAYLVTFRNEITFGTDGLVTLRDVAVGAFNLIIEKAQFLGSMLLELMPYLATVRDGLKAAFGDIDFSNPWRALLTVAGRTVDSMINIFITGVRITLESFKIFGQAILYEIDQILPQLTMKIESWINAIASGINKLIRTVNQIPGFSVPELGSINIAYSSGPPNASPLNNLVPAITKIINEQNTISKDPKSPRVAPFESAVNSMFELPSALLEVIGEEESAKRRAAEAAQKLEEQFETLVPDVTDLARNFAKLSALQQELLGPLKQLKSRDLSKSQGDQFDDKAALFEQLQDPASANRVREGLRTDATSLASQINATEQAVNQTLSNIGQVAAGRMASAIDVVGVRTAVELERALAKMTPEAARQAQQILSTLKDQGVLKVADQLRIASDTNVQQLATLLQSTNQAGDQLTNLIQSVGLQASTQITTVLGSASQESRQQIAEVLSEIGDVGREKVAENLQKMGLDQANQIAEILKGVDEKTIQASNLMLQTAKDVLGEGAENIGVVVAVKLIAGFNAAMGRSVADLNAAGNTALSTVLQGAQRRADQIVPGSEVSPDVQRLNNGLEQSRQGVLRLNQELEGLKNKGTNAFNQLGGAAESMGEKTDEIGQKLKSTFESIFGHLENALVSFVTTGKLDFKSLINSILADLARMVIQMLIIRPLMGIFGGLFGFSAGGLVPGFASGGAVRGAGTSTSDSILARLSHGEFVVNARATEQYYPLLKAINDGGALMPAGWRLPQYGTGGIVGGFDTFDRLPTPSAQMRGESTSPQSARMTRMAAEQAQTMSTRNQRAAGTGGAVVMNSTVNVNVTSRGDANSDGQLIAKQVDAQIKSRFIELLQNERRPGGALSNAKVR